MKSEKILFFYNSENSRINGKNGIELTFWAPSLSQINQFYFRIGLIFFGIFLIIMVFLQVGIIELFI